MVKIDVVFVKFNNRFLEKCAKEGNMAAKGANNGTLATRTCLVTRVLIMELHLKATLPEA